MAGKKSFIHDTAIVETQDIGEGTRVWAFCNIQKGSRVGADCNVCDHCFIESNARIGNRVTIKNGVSLWDGVTIENDVFIGPNAIFTNDIRPRSRVHRDQYDRTLVRQGATIGAGAVIVAGNTIGSYAFVGAGAVVTGDVPDFALVFGNPAHLKGFVCKCGEKLSFGQTDSEKEIGTARCSCGLKYRIENEQVAFQP